MDREKVLQKKYADLQFQIKQLQETHRLLQEEMVAAAQVQKMNNLGSEEVSSTTNGEINMEVVDSNALNGEV